MYDDIEAIILAIQAALDTNPLSAGQVNGIGHNQVDSGVLPPYIVVMRVGAVPEYAFKSHIAYEDLLYIIRYFVAPPDEDTSAERLTGEIHSRVFLALQGARLHLGGDVWIKLRRGQEEPPEKIVISSEEQYLQSGFKWMGTTAT